ncbi:MAG: low molecular weight protein-tyrosine-phosphatase [Bacteroidota bacterium]
MPTRVLFVCLGNICRSPLAEGVFRQKVHEHGLDDQFEIDSAGTGAWHAGEAPDARMRETARRHGVSIDEQRARQLVSADLSRYDHIFVMDRSNLRNAQALDRSGRHAGKIRLFRDFDPNPGDRNVPDPYYGGADGFETVYQIVDRTSEALLRELSE